MLEKAQQLKLQFEEKVNTAKTPADLEQLRIEFLGKKGAVASLMSELRNVPNDQKKEAGQIINEVKQFVENTIKEKILNFRSWKKNVLLMPLRIMTLPSP